MKRTLFILLFITAFNAIAQTPVPVTGLNCGTMEQYCTAGNKTFFATYNGLYVTDYTIANTKLVKPFSIQAVQTMTSLNDILYFINREDSMLWKSDGTANGTMRLGSGYKIPEFEQHLTVFNNQIVFTASDSVYGTELWRSDGTQQGTKLLFDIDKGDYYPYPIDRVVALNRLYFSQNDSTYQYHYSPKLWETDGSNIKLITDTLVFSQFSYNNFLYYKAIPNDTSTMDFFCTCNLQTSSVNCTSSDIIRIEDYQVVNDKIVFIASTQLYGFKLFSVDTFGNNFTKLSEKNFNSISTTPADKRKYLQKKGSDIFAITTADRYTKLWKSDGTIAGTKEVTIPNNLLLGNVIAGNDDYLFFKAYDTATKYLDVYYTKDAVSFQKINYPASKPIPPYSRLYDPYLFAGGSMCASQQHLIYTTFYGDSTGNQFYIVDLKPLNVSDAKPMASMIYPNPATEFIIIEETNFSNATISDNTGKIVTATTQNKINIQRF